MTQGKITASAAMLNVLKTFPFVNENASRNFTISIYHVFSHLYKNMLRDAQSLLHNRCSFLRKFHKL